MKHKIRVLVAIFIFILLKYIYEVYFNNIPAVVEYPLQYQAQLDVIHSIKEDKKEMQILFFTSRECLPCIKMKKIVWPHKSIQSSASEYYNSPKMLDASNVDNHSDFERYNIHAVPTTIIVDSEAEEMKRSIGYMDVKELLEFLK
tara:strand:- start:11817 stop:12251 length:435 start_codon:yes stop_codon:yes gene_type:complete